MKNIWSILGDYFLQMNKHKWRERSLCHVFLLLTVSKGNKKFEEG